jgi:two-component system, sensor histidine kinase LadS
MPWRVLALAAGHCFLAFLLLVAGAAASAKEEYPRATLQLADRQDAINAQEMGGAWVDVAGTATLEQVMQGAIARFRPAQPDLIYTLGEKSALWLHYRVSRPAAARGGWQLVFPMPSLDAVTVYQRDGTGQWVGQSAGDAIAVAQWPEPGRYPHFRLEVPRGEERDVYVRIRHQTSADFPVRFMANNTFMQHIQIEYLGLGLTFGALLLLIAVCLAQSLVYRDRV